MLKRYAVTNTGDIEEHPEGMVVLFDDVEGETYSQAHVDRLHRHREQAYEDVARISAENKALVDKLDARSWQPIKTAPKGERVIVAKIAASSMDYGGGGIPPHVWFAVTATHNGRYWTDGVEKLVEPTHWMPLPEVPQ